MAMEAPASEPSPEPHDLDDAARALPMQDGEPLREAVVAAVERLESALPQDAAARGQQTRRSGRRSAFKKHQAELRRPLCVPQTRMRRLVKAVFEDVTGRLGELDSRRDLPSRIGPDAIMALHTVAEMALAEVFADSTLLAQHARRVAVFDVDMQAAVQLRQRHGEQLLIPWDEKPTRDDLQDDRPMLPEDVAFRQEGQKTKRKVRKRNKSS